MKEALETYFKKLKELYRRYFGTSPTVCYTENLNKDLLISSPNEDGEVEWSPKLQSEAIDWNRLEEIFGFKINEELKSYYGTYLFLSLDGKDEGIALHFQSVGGSKPIESTVRQNLSDGRYVFPGTQTFLLGDACINSDDGYFIFFDNITGQVYCYESDTKKKVAFSHTLTEIIARMEAIL